MKCSALLAATLASLASARALTFQEKCDNYRCLTLDTFENWSPACATHCFHENLGKSKDGCAPDDFRCHCKYANSIAPLMRSCLTSNSTGCSSRDLAAVGAGVNEMCAYFNQTKYEAYKDCTKLMYSFVQFADGEKY